jgi:hypothetical protein
MMSSAKSVTLPGCGNSAMSGGLPPSICVPICVSKLRSPETSTVMPVSSVNWSKASWLPWSSLSTSDPKMVTVVPSDSPPEPLSVAASSSSSSAQADAANVSTRKPASAARHRGCRCRFIVFPSGMCGWWLWL